MGKRSCYLCSNEVNASETNVSLHKFPKNELIRKLWIQACDLCEATDDVRNLWICSKHFYRDDYAPSVNGNRLKKEAVPSVNIPGTIPNSINAPSTSAVVLTGYELVELLPCNVNGSSIDLSMKSTRESAINEATSLKVDEPASWPQELKNNSGGEVSFSDDAYSNTPEKKRRFYHPRYIAEISLADVQTPRSAKRVIAFVKEHALKQSKKIKMLQNQNRRLQSQVSSLQSLVQQLQKKGTG